MMIKARWMRGGTSKCWVFEEDEITRTGYSADLVLPRVFGSPDPRQLDGVGGATSTTSKALIVERSEREDIDVNFTFAQVDIEEARVDWGSNCGNCSAAVGLFALERGWVPTRGERTVVRTLNNNTGQVIIQSIPTPGGELPSDPDDRIPGVVFPGHPVSLGFLNPEGRTTGELLPTGAPRQTMTLHDGREVTVTLLDAGAPLIIVEAAGLGFPLDDYDQWLQHATTELFAFEELRRQAAVMMGLADTREAAERAVPKIGIVGPARSEDVDLHIMMMSMGKPHPAMPITGSVAVTVAARTPGTVVSEALSAPLTDELKIRIPVGVLSTFTEQTAQGRTVGVQRTARTLADAVLPVPEGQLAAASAGRHQEVSL